MESSSTKTPTLSKKQQQKSFSFKKAKRETIKNLVTTPYVNYWPIIKGEDVDLLVASLYNHLKLFKTPKLKIPWKLIKDVPAEKRKEFRIKYNEQGDNNDTMVVDKKSIILGVNSITQHLEQTALASLLISDDVKPHLMVRHLIDMSVMNGIPVLIVPKLREILQAKLGIKSVAFGLKKDLEQDSNYYLLNEKIRSIYNNYPVPEAQINFPRQRLFDSENIDTTAEDLDHNLSLSSTPNSQDDAYHEESEMEVDEKPPQDIYLYRKSKKERVFIPNSIVEVEKSNTLDFISFDRENNENNTSEQKMETYEIDTGVNKKRREKYQGLVVKRIKSNSERMQKKIEGIKKKKMKKKIVIKT
ncbi:ribonuclease P protein subunit p38-like [Agrilus planipennis]|uniref:Ribonuclease P protein subunit p38-like n=1 Tax=Agrilus planipennis TaxID=224129 RepID=A0A1W4X100_AGRPL|nr:ribonuclease P protein subunit p38-like [Agrilus planipennis]